MRVIPMPKTLRKNIVGFCFRMATKELSKGNTDKSFEWFKRGSFFEDLEMTENTLKHLEESIGSESNVDTNDEN